MILYFSTKFHVVLMFTIDLI